MSGDTYHLTYLVMLEENPRQAFLTKQHLMGRFSLPVRKPVIQLGSTGFSKPLTTGS
jgi:hypothetical protein